MAGKLKIKIDDPSYAKALAHPLRIRILAMLRERPASPVRLAERVDATLGTVAYHVRTLHKLGLIELVETRQRRGATEHLYQALETPRFSDEAWDGLGPVVKQRLLGAMLRQIGEYVNGSAAAGGFDRPDANLSRLSIKVDEQGWEELAKATKSWLTEVDRIEAEVRERTDKGRKHELIEAGIVLLLFEALAFSDQEPALTQANLARGATHADGQVA